MSDELNSALRFVKDAKKIIEINESMSDYERPYHSCTYICGGGIHIAGGIEKLATYLGIKELKVYTYPNDNEPYQKQFTYDGVLFYQLLDVCEKSDLIRSGAKTIQLSEVESANNK